MGDFNLQPAREDKIIGAISLNGLPADDQARRMLLALADPAATAITDDLTGLYNRREFFQLGQRVKMMLDIVEQMA